MLQGFGLSGYRSFGPEYQEFFPLGKVNLLIGPNNAGKSNVMRFLAHHYNPCLEAVNSNQDFHSGWSVDHDKPRHHPNLDLGFSFYFKKQNDAIEKINSKLNATKWTEDFLFPNSPLVVSDELYKLRYRKNNSNTVVEADFSDAVFENVKTNWKYIRDSLFSITNPEFSPTEVSRILKQFTPGKTVEPKIYLVPAIRELKAGNFSFGGSGLIDKLAKYQSPEFTSLEMVNDFDNINKFLRSVIGSPDAKINIPESKSDILVFLDGRTLPLSSLGTGILEVIIIAAAATIEKNSIFCIEEPEIHLHPGIQRRLMEYLSKETDNQYFVATHSAHIIDTLDAEIFDIQLQNADSKVTRLTKDKEKFESCVRMGYRASDILQTNYVIWVEGPSDRIYLKHWLRSADPTLLEGKHFSIMWFGGSLLSWLTSLELEDLLKDDSASEKVIKQKIIDEPLDFVAINRVNRWFTIITDSDLKPEQGVAVDKEIFFKPALLRLVAETIEDTHCHFWITQGRTIENYFDGAIFESVIKMMNPECQPAVEEGLFGRRFMRKSKDGKKLVAVDKVKLAQRVLEKGPEISEQTDLNERINELVSHIRKANGLDEVKTKIEICSSCELPIPR